jgi:rRNA maturation protein Nop10
MALKKCPKCKNYTFESTCPKCSSKTDQAGQKFREKFVKNQKVEKITEK